MHGSFDHGKNHGWYNSPWNSHVTARLLSLWSANMPVREILPILIKEFGPHFTHKATLRKLQRMRLPNRNLLGRDGHFKWETEHLDRIAVLWARGDSGSQIAATMSREFDRPFTRNGILGKARKLGLANRSRGCQHPPETDPVILAERAARRRAYDRAYKAEQRRQNGIKPRLILSPAERYRRKLERQRIWDRAKRPNHHAEWTRSDRAKNPDKYAKRIGLRNAAPIIEDFAIPTPQRKTFIDLGARDCRWGVGDPKSDQFFFCGATSEQDRPYCPAHCRRAYIETRSY